MEHEMINKIYGRWTVLSGPLGGRFLCRCDCGKEKYVDSFDLRSGKSTCCRTCGSKGNKSTLSRQFSHIERNVFRKIRDAAKNAVCRCENPSHSRYPDWGGRGIKVIFPNLESFIEYLIGLPGHDDLSLVIDRIDNNKNYEPGNLQFVTRSESQLNRRVEGGEHGYYVNNDFDQCFKKLHDNGVSFETIGKLYCANQSTVRNCVRELEESA